MPSKKRSKSCGTEVSLTEVTKPGGCQVRIYTESPCPRSAKVEILGVAFCGPCAREQEAYFAIGELTHEEARDLHSKPLADVLERKRRDRGSYGWYRRDDASRALERTRDQTSRVQEELSSIDSFRRNSLL
jgi:hypothetical protein